MKLLHTSDWHLGVSHETASCDPEQTRFLAWLVGVINDHQIDVLVVAGDIFHYAQPSNRAQETYFNFLLRCDRDTNLKKVIIVAGNHDSPSGLDAPRQILRTLNIHVVGRFSAGTDPDDILIPLAGPTGAVELVVAAVPYVRTADLGISAVDKSPEQARQEFQQAFTDLYSELADRARRDHPDAALVATGHLTCYGPKQRQKEGDFHTPLHNIGTIDALPPSIFDDRFDYVALGHIHRCFPVEDRRIWYAGTPVPTGRKETSQRSVLIVEFSDQPRCKPLAVPRWRDVIELTGSTEEVLRALSELPCDKDLAPHLFVALTNLSRDYENPPFKQILSALEGFDEPRPRIVDFRESLVAPDRVVDDEPPEQLEDLSPEDVFVRLYRSRHENTEPDNELLQAFRELLEPDDEEPPPGDLEPDTFGARQTEFALELEEEI